MHTKNIVEIISSVPSNKTIHFSFLQKCNF
jgi:hypothetical protein